MAGVAEQREHTLTQRVLSSQAFWVTVALLAMCAIMTALQPQAFASTENFYNITRNFSFGTPMMEAACARIPSALCEHACSV